MRSALLLSFAALVAAAPPVPAPRVPAPPAPPAPRPYFNAPARLGPAEPTIVRFRAEPPRCGGEEVRPVLSEEPFPTGTLRWTPARDVVVRFRIDAEGRPLGISEPIPSAQDGLNLTDLAPALAAWRFATGRERPDCEVAFRPEARPVRTAAAEWLYRFLALHPASRQPVLWAVGRPAFERARPNGTTCYAPPPNVRLQGFPPYETIAQPPGVVSFSFLEHDIDARGAPRNVRLVGSSGNAALDRESIVAQERSRFQPGRRVGCINYFFLRQTEPMAPPPPPAAASFRAPDADCPPGDSEWAFMPSLVFPPAFNTRSIEGWAVLRFDLLASGDTRNVEVLAAEPAAAFGEQGRRIVRAARKPPSDRAYGGCTARVIFRLPEKGEEPPQQW